MVTTVMIIFFNFNEMNIGNDFLCLYWKGHRGGKAMDLLNLFGSPCKFLKTKCNVQFTVELMLVFSDPIFHSFPFLSMLRWVRSQQFVYYFCGVITCCLSTLCPLYENVDWWTGQRSQLSLYIDRWESIPTPNLNKAPQLKDRSMIWNSV